MKSQGGPPTWPRGKAGFPEERCGAGCGGGEDAGQLEPWRRALLAEELGYSTQGAVGGRAGGNNKTGNT